MANSKEAKKVTLADVAERQVQLTVKFAPDISLATVNKFVLETARLNGCPECGFNGVDLRIMGSLPYERMYDKLDGVTVMEVSRPTERVDVERTANPGDIVKRVGG